MSTSTIPPQNIHAARSDQRARHRFGRAEVAARYPAAFRTTGRDRHEERCLRRALRQVPAGATVLDLPCGSGRLTSLLLEHGYRVLAADSSQGMVSRARHNWLQRQTQTGACHTAVSHFTCDVMATGLPDASVDAVICNRLLHHFTEAETRRQALRELARVTNGPIIVSFFNSFALDAVKFHIKHWLRGTTPQDRIPISLAQFRADVQAAGLTVTQLLPTRWGISPQWYAVLERPYY